MRNSDRFTANKFKPLETPPHYVQANVQLIVGFLYSRKLSLRNEIIPFRELATLAPSVKFIDA
jgi:hypothetical protein